MAVAMIINTIPTVNPMIAVRNPKMIRFSIVLLVVDSFLKYTEDLTLFTYNVLAKLSAGAKVCFAILSIDFSQS
jgi:hypothetical protein